MNYKRWNGIACWPLFFVLFFFTLFLLSSCIKKPENRVIETPANGSDGSVANTIQLVTDSYIPYSFEENGVIKGIAVDVYKELFQRIGFQVNLKVVPWTRVLEMAKDGETDGIFIAFYVEERALYLEYSKEPLVYETSYIYTRKGSPVIFNGDIHSLEPYQIGAIQDYYMGDSFEQAEKAGLLKVDRIAELSVNIQKLLDGKIDAMADYEYSTMYYLKQMDVSDKIVQQPAPLTPPTPMYLAFSKKRLPDPDLIRRIDEELVKMKSDGSYQRIMDNYLKPSSE